MRNTNLDTYSQVAERSQSNQLILDSKEVLESSQFDISKVTLKISKVAEMSELEREKLFDIFNSFKFVILDCEHLPNLQANLLALKRFFGSVKRHHKKSDEEGILPILDLGSSTDLTNNNQPHPIHTDGTFYIEPPKVVALQCEIPAKNGGISQVVYAESVYKYFMEHHPQELQTLFTPGSLTITKDNQTSRRAIFTEKEGRISVRFRSDKFVSTEILPQVEQAVSLFQNYINDPNHQIMFTLKANQILLLENTAVLHGRTSFPKNDPRKLNKLWFEGDSEYACEMQFGFQPKSVTVVDTVSCEQF
ncbi:TauD/TfdA family dioxygenase [Scytonema sp. PCC 10023]|uniref:TauD/TfdA family dioxygenase n=1 Tax=Scytonema sp. PCC 10023 TaxID=1680591 RepID=UPI0039C6832E